MEGNLFPLDEIEDEPWDLWSRNKRVSGGLTGDLKKRVAEHQKGHVRSTKHRRPFTLIYYEACLSEDDAIRREKYLKFGMGKRYLRQRLKKSLSDL